MGSAYRTTVIKYHGETLCWFLVSRADWCGGREHRCRYYPSEAKRLGHMYYKVRKDPNQTTVEVKPEGRQLDLFGVGVTKPAQGKRP